MRLLMITRRVDKDDGLAGFTFNWIKKLAVNLDQLEVICLEKGNTEGLPANVRVYSLGKEKGKSRWHKFWRFQSLAKSIVLKVDGVFAHQNPEYGILISLWTKLYRKKLIAWYVHKEVSLRLRCLNFLADKMVSVSRKSFRLNSKKVVFLHHGIDTDIFSFRKKEPHKEWRFLSVSRISKTKNIHLMLDVIRDLKKRINHPIVLKIAGEASLDQDKKYLESLKKRISDEGLDSNVRFLGSVANDKTPELYQEADIFFNFSQTGSVDKAVLEAMSSGTLVFVSNEAFSGILEPINPLMYVRDFSRADRQLENLLTQADQSLARKLRDYVVSHHNLDDLVKRIVKLF